MVLLFGMVIMLAITHGITNKVVIMWQEKINNTNIVIMARIGKART